MTSIKDLKILNSSVSNTIYATLGKAKSVNPDNPSYKLIEAEKKDITRDCIFALFALMEDTAKNGKSNYYSFEIEGRGTIEFKSPNFKIGDKTDEGIVFREIDKPMLPHDKKEN